LKKKRKTGKDFFCKVKKIEKRKKAKEINYFREIGAKKIRSKMGNDKKGHNKTVRTKAVAQ